MKKIVILMISLLIMASLIGCSVNNETADEDVTTDTIESVVTYYEDMA